MYFVGLQIICTTVNVLIYVDDKAKRCSVLSRVDRPETKLKEKEEEKLDTDENEEKE